MRLRTQLRPDEMLRECSREHRTGAYAEWFQVAHNHGGKLEKC